MTDNQRKLAANRQGNLEAARIVAADRDKYPEGSLRAIWAAMVLDRAEETTIDTTVDAPVAGPLFDTEAA